MASPADGTHLFSLQPWEGGIPVYKGRNHGELFRWLRGSSGLSRGHRLASTAGVSQGTAVPSPEQDRAVDSLRDTVVVWGDVIGHCMLTEVLTLKAVN